MDVRRQISLSELKVGVFVVVACLVLAIAIFTIGTQVGLLEESFLAKTYLNNVSGLKAGDIVLLGGVDVGNVTRVEISPPGRIPPTENNLQKQLLIRELSQRTEVKENQISDVKAGLETADAEYQDVVRQQGRDSDQAFAKRRKVIDLQDELGELERDLEETRGNIQDARSKLQNIVVYMQIQSQRREWIRHDSRISLGSVGLLGDKYIEISLGRIDLAPETDTETVETWLGKETREVVLITGTTQAGFQELITGANDIVANVNVLSNRLERIFSDLVEGQGTAGKFLDDPSFYNNLNETVLKARRTIDEGSEFLQNLYKGPGTIPLLIRKSELYDSFHNFAGRLEKILADVESGRGTLGKFVNDPGVYEKSDQVIQNMEAITQRISEGKGTLGKLSQDERVYTDLQRSLNQLAVFLADVEEGKGTLGRLAKDEQLYQNLNQVSSEVIKLIYDFRQDPKKFLTIKFELF